MSKIYFVESELCPRIQFNNESDRNEMTLALWQEQIYFLWARTLNWYEDGIVDDIEDAAYANVYTYECQTWYDVPTQVAWFDENHYCAGIAYHNEVMCACCGGIIEIDEIIGFAPDGVVPIIEYKHWVNFEEEIIGDGEAGFYYEED